MRAIDSPILPELGTLASQQQAPTHNTLKRVNDLLQYLATYPWETLRYYQSNMNLSIESDASFLSEPSARSRFASHFSFPTSNKHITQNPCHVESAIIPFVVTSSAEAELVAIYNNIKLWLYIIHLLERLNHPQPTVPIITDSMVAKGLVTATMKPKKSKFLNMRYFYIRYHLQNKTYNIHRKPSQLNRADYFTKHHTTLHHKNVRTQYVYDTIIPKK